MMVNKVKKTLVVIPSESLEEYRKAGYLDKLIQSNYFNPKGLFDEVFIVSPLEPYGERVIGKYRVIGTTVIEFPKVIEKINPTIVRAYGSFWACDLAVYSKLKCPIVVSVHDSTSGMFHHSLRFSDKVICVSSAVKKQSLKIGVDKDKIEILNNWVDLSKFEPSNKSDYVKRLTAKYGKIKPILFVGRMEKQKNPETLIRALKLLPNEYVAFMIGRGDKKTYEELAKREGVISRCHFIEYIPNELLKYWYSWCKVMCMPSIWEGFGIVFIEALACGASVVTSNIPPMNEFLKSGYNAMLISHYRDPVEVARIIKTVCENTALRRSLSRNAIESAKVFSRDSIQSREAKIMINTKKQKLKWFQNMVLNVMAIRYLLIQILRLVFIKMTYKKFYEYKKSY